EGKQSTRRGIIERRPRLARLERLGELDRLAALGTVTFYKLRPKSLGLLAQARLDLLGEPDTPFSVSLRNLIERAGVIRQPFVELRLVTVQHIDDLVEHRPDIDCDLGIERARL